MQPLDLAQVKTYPLAQRRNLVHLNDLFDPAAPPPPFESTELEAVAQAIITARLNGRAVVWMMGAHVIKSGLSRLLIRLLEMGVITHIAGNGAVSIHDFELALIGETSEDVATSLEDGTFGMAEETGGWMHRAIQQGARDGLGYGAAIGRFISQNPALFRHPELNVLYTAYRLGIPATIHATIGTDIIHQHPQADFGAIGAASGLDFRLFAASVSQLEGGVFLNFGSAVTGPEVFLKALTVARNLGHTVKHITTANFDLRPLPDYHAPVKDTQPDYYYRPRKNIINRPTSLGGQGYHITGDHIQTIPNLYHRIVPALEGRIPLPAAPVHPAPSAPRPAAGAALDIEALTRGRLQALLAAFRGLRVGIAGDLALDAYWQVDMTRSVLSRETPLFPRPVVAESYSPGAGGNVACNLAALGIGDIQVFSVCGTDSWGDLLRAALQRAGIQSTGLLTSPQRCTTTYIKPQLIGYNARQEDARFDFENTQALSSTLEDALLERLAEALPGLDALILVDQLDQQGVITPRVRAGLNALAERHPQVVFVVDSRRHISEFRGMALKPNWIEACQAAREMQPALPQPIPEDPRSASLADLAEIGRALSRRAGQPVFITLSEKGVLVCQPESGESLPAAPVTPPLDPVGAGDCFIAALAAGLACGAGPRAAAQLAILAAGVTVEKIGQTGSASPDEILARFDRAAGAGD